MSEVTFKSRHPNTISFSNDGFNALLEKEFDTLLCKMSDGVEVRVARHTLTSMWARQRKYVTMKHGFPIKVLTVK